MPFLKRLANDKIAATTDIHTFLVYIVYWQQANIHLNISNGGS